jgi:hypothetical protein
MAGPVSLTYPVQMASIERYIVAVHGSPRPLTAREIRVVDAFAEDCLAQIEEAWPVETSLSRDSFTYEVQDGGYTNEPIGFEIQNDVWYVQYVHLAGHGPTPLWTYLVPEVVHNTAPKYLQLLRQAISDTESELKRGASFNSIISRVKLAFGVGARP